MQIGELHYSQGNFQQALDIEYEALVIMRDVKDMSGIAGTLKIIGTITREQKKFHETYLAFEEALPIARAHGDIQETSQILRERAIHYCIEHAYDDAERDFGECLNFAQMTAMPHVLAMAFITRAQARLEYLREGARTDAEQALLFCRDLKNSFLEGFVLSIP